MRRVALARLHGQRRGDRFGIRRRGVGQLDIELAYGPPIDIQPHMPRRGAGPHRQIRIRAVTGISRVAGSEAWRAIALHDLIGQHVPPSAGMPIDNLDHRLASGQILDIPSLPIEMLASAAGSRSGRTLDDATIDQQLDARLGRMMAAADQKIDEGPLDFERGRNERPLRSVTTQVTIHQPVAKKSGHGHLIGERAVRRRLSERVPFAAPSAVIIPFEIGDNEVGPVVGARSERQSQTNNNDVKKSHTSAPVLGRQVGKRRTHQKMAPISPSLPGAYRGCKPPHGSQVN